MLSKPATRRGRLGFRLLALAVGAVVALGILELGLRSVGWKAPGFYIDGRGPQRLRWATAEHGPFPPGHGRLVHFSFDVAWSVNRDGFREREPVPKRGGERRVGILGDSIAAGFGVELPERFADLWRDARYGEEAGADLWNLGAAGAGTHVLADILGGVGASYELDEVVLALFADNELGDNLGWEERRRSVAADDEESSRYQGLRDLLREHSRLALFVWLEVGHRLLYQLDPGPSPSAELTAGWEATARALDRFRVATAGRPWRLWYLPAWHEWDDEHWRLMQARYGMRDGERWALRDAVVAWAAARGVPVVDATVALWGQSASVVKFPTDGHWTVAGHRRVADRLVAASP